MNKIISNPTECGYRIHEQSHWVCNNPNTDGTICINEHSFPGYCPLPSVKIDKPKPPKSIFHV